MRRRYLLRLLLPLVMLAACTERESPTAPAESGGMAEGHSAGHKVVNSVADPGDGTCTAAQCTLREAINDPTSTEITFAPGLTGPITLARSGLGGGTLVIEKTLTITGPSTRIVIRRRSTDPAFRIFRIGSGVTVRLTNLTIRNGKTTLDGGGIINFGTLALTRCTVAGNSATMRGGGISNHGPLTLTNSAVAGNSAGIGGGIDNRRSGTLTLANTIVTGNSATGGGGISNRAGTLVLTNTTIAGNSASFSGGGISDVAGTATLTNTRIVGNSADEDEGGGIRTVNGRFTLVNSTVARNSATRDGGGIANHGVFTLTNSTVVGNSTSENGGGISNQVVLGRVGAALTLTNSTVSGNSAGVGGGIFTEGQEFSSRVTLVNSTVARNSATQGGGGIRVSFESFPRLTSSLVAQNSAPTGPDVHDPVNTQVSGITARFSLIGDGSGNGITNTDGNQVGSAGAPIDPLLAPLANYGGPTATHRLLPGSPAIDAASATECPATDQRGVPRPQGAGCDIGSFERIVP